MVCDLSARWIGCGLIDLSDFERKRIRDGHMAGDLRLVHRIFGGGSVELMAVWKIFIGPEVVIPSSSGDPFAGFVLRDGASAAPMYFLRGRRARLLASEVGG